MNKEISLARQSTLFSIFAILFFSMTIISCGGGTSSSDEYTTTTEYDPTQGIITEVKETEKDLYKITDETIVATKEDSRIIAEYLDGVRDTFTLEEAQLVDADNPRRSRMRPLLMGGLMGYMMGKSMSTPTSRNAYATDDAYKKSQANNSKLKSTAKTKTVKNKKSGFGKTKSSKSYGG